MKSNLQSSIFKYIYCQEFRLDATSATSLQIKLNRTRNFDALWMHFDINSLIYEMALN